MDAQKEPVTKIDGAQRQLDCAIRLFFNNDDSLAVHTLGNAAFRVLFDLYPRRRGDGFDQHLSRTIETLGWRRFNRVPNFLKHADSDPEAVLAYHSPEAVQTSLGLASILHHRITGRMTPEMRAFDAWMHLMHPEAFQLPPDPDADFEAVFRESVAFLRASSWDERLVLGRTLIGFYNDHRDVGGFGAPRAPAEP